MFTKFTNKFRQFWAPHGVKPPPPAITATIELGEEFHKLRARAKATQNSLLEAARDKARAEKEDAKKDAKKVSRILNSTSSLNHHYFQSKHKKQVLSAEVVQSEPEDSVIVVDEDTVMDDLVVRLILYTFFEYNLKLILEPQDAQGDDDLDSIDADAFMAEIDDAKKEKALKEKAKASSSKLAPKLVRNSSALA